MFNWDLTQSDLCPCVSLDLQLVKIHVNDIIFNTKYRLGHIAVL